MISLSYKKAMSLTYKNQVKLSKKGVSFHLSMGLKFCLQFRKLTNVFSSAEDSLIACYSVAQFLAIQIALENPAERNTF